MKKSFFSLSRSNCSDEYYHKCSSFCVYALLFGCFLLSVASRFGVREHCRVRICKKKAFKDTNNLVINSNHIKLVFERQQIYLVIAFFFLASALLIHFWFTVHLSQNSGVKTITIQQRWIRYINSANNVL